MIKYFSTPITSVWDERASINRASDPGLRYTLIDGTPLPWLLSARVHLIRFKRHTLRLLRLKAGITVQNIVAIEIRHVGWDYQWRGIALGWHLGLKWNVPTSMEKTKRMGKVRKLSRWGVVTSLAQSGGGGGAKRNRRGQWILPDAQLSKLGPFLALFFMPSRTDRVATARCRGDHTGSISLALPSFVGDP